MHWRGAYRQHRFESDTLHKKDGIMAKKKKSDSTANIACKYRIYPTESQIAFIIQTIGCNRWFWNYLISESKKAYEETKERPSALYELARRLPGLKEDEATEWLKKAESTSLIYTASRVDEAYAAFHRKRAKGMSVKMAGLPKRHKKRRCGAFTKQCNSKVNYIDWGKNLLFLSTKVVNNDGKKEPWVKAVLHRKVQGTPKSITYSVDIDGKFYASVIFEYEAERTEPEKPTFEKTLGVDLSMKDFGRAYGSDNELREVKCDKAAFERIEKHINVWKVRASRRYNRNQKRNNQSKGYYEATNKYLKLTARLNKMKEYATHMMTSEMVRDERYSTISVESLDVSSMVKKLGENAKKGEVKKRKNRARNNNKARMGLMASQIEYKAKMNGKNFVKIDRYFPSSQECSSCGFIFKGAKDYVTKQDWKCPQCGTRHQRDFNAAKNIKMEGFRILTEEK